MPFSWDNIPYTNFHELNIDYFINKFKEIFDEWADLYNTLTTWKDTTTTELETWKIQTENDILSWENSVISDLNTWKSTTEIDISSWETATLNALDAWKTATTAIFEAIRVEAAGSATAAANSATAAGTAKTAAEAAQAAAEAAATSVTASTAQIATNTNDINDLKTQLDDIVDDVRDISYPWIEGYRLQTNVYTVNPNEAAASANYAYIIQSCEKGEKYVVTTSANTTFRGCVLTDTSYNVYQNVGDVLTNAEVTPTKDGYIICNTENRANTHTLIKSESYTDFKEDVLDFMDDTASELSSIEQKVPYVNKYVYDSVYTETQISFPNTGLLDTRYGTVLPEETSYKTTDFVDITGLYGIYRTGTTVRYGLWRYCFYDENQTFLPPGVNDTTDYDIVDFQGKDITWLDIADAPAGAKYIKISWQASRPYTYWTVVTVSEKTGYNLPQITIDGVKPLKFVGKKIVNFGDSIFGNFRDTNTTTDRSISKMIEESTGATVYNAGFGGCRMGLASDYWDAFSMHSLADSIASGSWSVQDAALVSGGSNLPEYFSDTVDMLKEINFGDIDYITIGYGTNDYAGNAYINSTDVTFTHEWDYFKGALQYSIRTILNAFPNLKIIVVSPCWRWFPDANGAYSYDSDDAQSKNTRDYKLSDYVDACESVCEAYHVPYIDTYYTLGFNPYSYSAYFPVKGIDGYTVSDGTHPKQNGRQLRADRIVGQMEALY